jgi:sec-independent protein translocase protein TatB
MARQSELDELRSELEALRNERPLADVHDALNNAIVPPDMQSKPSVSVSSEDVMTPIVHEPVEPEPPLPDPATVTDVLKNPPAP